MTQSPEQNSDSAITHSEIFTTPRESLLCSETHITGIPVFNITADSSPDLYRCPPTVNRVAAAHASESTAVTASHEAEPHSEDNRHPVDTSKSALSVVAPPSTSQTKPLSEEERHAGPSTITAPPEDDRLLADAIKAIGGGRPLFSDFFNFIIKR